MISQPNLIVSLFSGLTPIPYDIPLRDALTDLPYFLGDHPDMTHNGHNNIPLY
jgi:hypothetical protein